MANTTVYPYGTGGSLPSSIGIINDVTTGGVDKALSAEQGKYLYSLHFETEQVELCETGSSTTWLQGNIANGVINTSYHNYYFIVGGFPLGAESITIERAAPPDSTYTMNIYVSSNATNFTYSNSFGTTGGTKTIEVGENVCVLLLLYDQPSLARAQQEVVTFTASTSTDAVEEKIDEIRGGRENYALTWVTGNIENNGSLLPSYANKSTDFIELVQQDYYIFNPTKYNVKIAYYTSTQTFIDFGSGVGPYFGYAQRTAPSNAAYLRLCVWDKPSDADVVDITVSYESSLTLPQLQNEINALSGSGYYSNPILMVDSPDPSIVKGPDGYYYMLATGRLENKPMYRSINLIDWEIADRPFTDQAVSDCFAAFNVSTINFWAPEIVKIGNKYNLYCSRGSGPMLVFQSDHPNFGYEYIGQIINTTNGLAGDNIDACVRYDLDGTLWIFWGSTYMMYRQRLSDDGLTLGSVDTKAHVAGRPISEDSSRATVFEGAYLYRRQGYWYLFVSAGSYNAYTYCIKVGRSATLTGTFVDKDGNNMTSGYGTTILSSANGDAFFGPGHNGQIITDRNNRTYMLYHCHLTSGVSGERYLCMQELFWGNDGWPYFDYNSKPQPVNNVKPVL